MTEYNAWPWAVHRGEYSVCTEVMVYVTSWYRLVSCMGEVNGVNSVTSASFQCPASNIVSPELMLPRACAVSIKHSQDQNILGVLVVRKGVKYCGLQG